MKSLAHKDWPYIGTPWEWRGFAEKIKAAEMPKASPSNAENGATIYQKLNFGDLD